MKSKTRVLTGLVCAGSILLSAGCMSAKYEKEAEGLEFEETVAAVAVDGVPGGAVIDTIAIQAKVLGINYAKREVKLLVPGGHVVKTRVGEEAINFDQVKQGDIVNAVITEELVFQLVKAGIEVEDGAAVAAALAKKGELPAGMVEAAVRVTATIKAIDTEARIVTLKLADGTTKTVPVRDDIEMKQAKVGDQVVIDMFEAILLSVDHVEK